MVVRSASMLLAILAACSGAAVPNKKVGPVEVQFAFFHFDDDRVRVIVDGRAVFDQTITVALENKDYGLAEIARVNLPECSDIVVTSRKQRLAKRLCLTAQTKSVVIDGGPPLTIAAKDQLQGID